MTSKSSEATLAAFRKIIQANGNVYPKELTVDLGNEFALLEEELKQNGGVLRRKNMQSVNTLSAVDAAIKKLKGILS